jgi:two-component system sensor histidine kinase RpfC
MRILRRRLKARPDSEHEQAILRIVIVALVLAYMGATYSPSEAVVGPGHGELLLLQGLAAALMLAIALFVAICVWPASNIPRRAIGMLADAGAATFCMFLAGESGVSMVGVYLFITFGNGFRYGRNYLFACQTLCLVGFYGVLQFVPFWQAHGVTGWCLMLALSSFRFMCQHF